MAGLSLGTGVEAQRGLKAAPAAAEMPLAADPGVWSGRPAPGLALQWQRSGADIPGASGGRFTPGEAETGQRLRLRVTAANRTGSATAFSDEIYVHSTAAGTPGTPPVPTQSNSSGDQVLNASNPYPDFPANNSSGSLSASSQLSAAAAAAAAAVSAPAVLTAPRLSGTGKIGAAVSVNAGSWSGKPAPTLALQWRRGGANIAGATGRSYVPVAADDKTALTCRVTASNAGGSASAVAAALQITRVAPVASGTLADVELVQGAAAGKVAAAGAFTGAGLAYAVSGAGAVIDAATGAVTIPTGTLLSAVAVTVTASNSGGSATASFKVSVKAAVVKPAMVTAPTLSGTGKIGATVSVDAGSWSGNPAPAIALQWRRGGADIAGATAASYTPVAADDRTALTCRVTASNAGGSASAVTAALAVTRVAPAASGTLADVELVQGAAAGSVAAAGAFTGAGLAYAVSGAGAVIDAATGVVTIPTGTLLSAVAVTVTASNSGGSASVSFKVSVVTKAAGVTVSTRQALLNAITASKDGDVIKIAPGTYDRFIWPKNTSHQLTLTAAQTNNPPILRGIWLSGADNVDPFWPSQTPAADWAKNLTIDGLRFQAEILDSVRLENGKTVDIRDADGRGFGWNADTTFPGVNTITMANGLTGIKIGSGCADIVIKNCLFEQYAKGINTAGATRITIENNDFSEICEDGIIIWGGTDLKFNWNVWKNSRGVSLKAAQAYGWKNEEPVHQDFVQVACNSAGQNVNGLSFSYNVIYDDTERVHGILLNNAYVGGSTAANLQGSRHKDVVADNNFMSVTHTTALQLTNVIGLFARRNKVIRSKVNDGSTKNDVALIVGAWGSADAQNCDNITVQNNVSRKYKGPWKDSWTWTGNVVDNDAAVLPTGWVEIRPELVKSGRKAGRYGNG